MYSDKLVKLATVTGAGEKLAIAEFNDGCTYCQNSVVLPVPGVIDAVDITRLFTLSIGFMALRRTYELRGTVTTRVVVREVTRAFLAPTRLLVIARRLREYKTILS